jgi:hypothetical protein
MLRKILVAACIALSLTFVGQDQNQPLHKFQLKAESEDFWKLFDRGARFTGGPVYRLKTKARGFVPYE